MKTIIHFDRLFVYSESNSLCFDEDFSKDVNIISGRNTSGKSTLIQSLLFAFGINDVKESLHEILPSQPIFRVDFTKKSDSGDEHKFSIVRDSGSIYIREPNGKIVTFHGIDADNRVEHIKFKDYIRELFNFKLILEQKGELKSAPLESMFLPYYVSQSVGWVYVRESFSNLNYYKGFKDDYLDYFLGISNSFDKVEYRNLRAEQDRLSSEISSLKRYSKSADFMFSNLLDEEFGERAQVYIDEYVKKVSSLEEERNTYIKRCNELSLLQNHQRILKRTKRNINNQKYNNVDRCPACTQVLSYSLEGLYSHYQKVNDTENLELHIKEKLQDKQSEINSSKNKIKNIESDISKNFGALIEKSFDGVTFEQWVDNKANIRLYKRTQEDIEQKTSTLEGIKESLGRMGTGQSTINKRVVKERVFKGIFESYLSYLNVKPMHESRYLDLYKINSFPYQGVELHKTVMSYHFAFNSIISKTKNIHRIPFLLDGILKEDIDKTNINLILSFVGRNLPTDTQSFISISEHLTDEEVVKSEDQGETKPFGAVKVQDIKNRYFPGSSKVIFIGHGKNERSFLSITLESCKFIYNDTCEIIEGVRS